MSSFIFEFGSVCKEYLNTSFETVDLGREAVASETRTIARGMEAQETMT